MNCLSFRPLSGILFLFEYFDFLKEKGLPFPSPVGDFVFIRNASGSYTFNHWVSVPCRGFCFYSRVPENGKRMDGSEFPSPVGDFVFIHPHSGDVSSSHSIRFRPLSGILFLFIR